MASKNINHTAAPELKFSQGAAVSSLPSSEPPVAPPLRASLAYWICQLAGWGLTAVINTLQSTSFVPDNVPTMAAIYIWAALSGLLLSHRWRSFLHRRGWLSVGGRPPWLRVTGGIALLGALQTGSVIIAFALARPPGSFKSWAFLPFAIFAWTLAFSVWTSIYAYTQSMRRAKRLESESLRFQLLAKDAELRALQAQVNPHFFFNSLNSVRALIYESPNAAAQMIDQLAHLMRHTLSSGRKATVDLREEIDAVRVYLAIEKIRFEERLRPVFDVDESLGDTQIPPMVLQTLVENAVKYGVERSIGDGVYSGEICITVKRAVESRDTVGSSSGVVISIANQGSLTSAADQTRLDTKTTSLKSAESTQLGVENAQKRLALLNGAAAQLTLIERDGWVIATLCLPAAP